MKPLIRLEDDAMKYVIVDLEMNPVSDEYPNERKVSKLETIQIGAVLLDE